MDALIALLARLLLWIGMSRPAERRRALTARSAVAGAVASELGADAERLHREMARRAAESHIVLGSVGDSAYRFTTSALRGAHAHIVAQPGAGKSRLLTAMIRSLLTQMWLGGLSYSVILVDPKGETVGLVMRLVAELLARLPRVQAEALAERIVTVRPFHGRFLVPIGMLARDPSIGLSSMARTVLELLWRTAGAAVGIRQEVAGEFALATLIANNIGLAEAPFILREPNVLRDLAERVPEPRLQSYFRSGGWAKEARQTVGGLLARIEAVVGVPELAAMVGSAESVDLRIAYAPGALVLVDLDGAPAGSTAIADAIGSYLMTRLGWSCFNRSGDWPRAAGTLLVADELARLATPSVLDVAERLLTTSRWLNTSLWSAAQYSSQIPELDRLLSANTRLRLFGRTTAREIEAAIQEWVGTGGPRLRPGGAGRSPEAEFMTDAEEARDWSRRVSRLPQRQFVVGDRSAPFGAQIIEAPAEEPIAWERVPADLRALVERGGFGVDREALIDASRTSQARAAERVARPPADDADVPDLAEVRARRSRRTEAH